MGNIPFPVYISLAFLEGISVLFFVFAFLQVNWLKKELLVFSVIYAILTFVLRQLPISFGIHSLILICLVSGFLTYYYKTKFSSALFGMILVFCIALLVEVSSAFAISKLTSFDHSVILSNSFWWFVSGLPHIGVLIIVSMIILKLRR